MRYNSEKLSDFIIELDKFNRDYDEIIAELNVQFNILSDFWKDPAYERFSTTYTNCMNNFNKLEESFQSFKPILINKLELLQEYEKTL